MIEEAAGLAGSSAATYIPSPSNGATAREEGEPSRAVGRQHETRGPAPGAGFNPLGNWGEFRRRPRGRPRKTVRYPFLEAAKIFLNSHVAYFGENTLRQRRRDLRVMARDLWSLRRNGLVTTTRPDRLSEADVAALVVYWRTRDSRYHGPMKPQTQRKYISILEMFLNANGNPVVSNMRRMRRLRVPTAPDSPIETLTTDQLDAIRRAAESMSGWKSSVARLLVVLLPACGLRRREIRLARLADLDLQRWRIRVTHPKGEGAWASDDVAPILPSARQAVLDFLEERKAFLDGAAHEALIPIRWADGTIGYWSDAPFGKLKAELERRSGVRFSLRMFRSTFAQVAKDYGVTIESVSKALRHKTTKTTETYYARIRADDAFADFEEKFARPPVRVIPR